VAEAIYGLRPVRSGRISVVGEDITTVSIKDRLAKGIALIPEDRIRQGILPRNSLAETLILGPHNFLFTHGSFDLQRARAMARKAIKEYNIAAPNEDIAASRLSGGNIQKVVAARAFLMSDLVNLRLIIAFNPTRGLDIMTTRFIHDRLMQMRNEGKGVLLISEDLDESLRLCDRVYVLYKGSVVGEFERAQFDPYKIGALMVGGEG
jgi:simple sugar transport system ATP-binding protein